MKVFSKEKFVEESRKAGVPEALIEMSLMTWAKNADGKPKSEVEKDGVPTPDEFCIEVEETEGKMDKNTFETKKIADLIEGSEAVICCSNKGIYVNGMEHSLLSLLTMIIIQLKENGCSDEHLKMAFELGTEGKDKAVKKMLDKLKEKLEEMAGSLK